MPGCSVCGCLNRCPIIVNNRKGGCIYGQTLSDCTVVSEVQPASLTPLYLAVGKQLASEEDLGLRVENNQVMELLKVLALSKKTQDGPMEPKEKSWPDWKYPEWRALENKLTVDGWLEGRRQDDGAEGLWRVHNSLYDVSTWVKSHPGGAQWLELTKGTDITELFESHHLGPLASNVLKNYYVRPAKTPRNSPFTFKEDGFYKTLKKRVYEEVKDIKSGPSTHSKRYLEAIAVLTVSLSVVAAINHSYFLGLVAGLFLALTTACAHNFFHMRDNWRMYIFNLSMFTVRQWRVSHSISHHMFPNTHHDLEISFFEPMFYYLPNTDKSKLFGILSALYSPIIYPTIFFQESMKRIRHTMPQAEDFVGLVIPALMIVVGVPFLEAMKMWLVVLMAGGFFFGLVEFTSGHQHPEIFHYGDKPRDDRDWGLFNLDAIRDRVETAGRPNLVLVTFGDHTLHHLFPTVDMIHLHKLYPTLRKTCKEFGVDFQLKTTLDMLKGQFTLIMKNHPNLNSR